MVYVTKVRVLSVKKKVECSYTFWNSEN